MEGQYNYEDYKYLDERLTAYARSDYYPFHMPGHKRRELYFENPYKIDITEIDGFDDLHHAKEILFQSQDRLRKLHNSKRAYYLVNGSTCGILSAIGALTKRGDKAIIARNCHKATYNAVKIFGLNAYFVYPHLISCGIQGKICPEDVEELLKLHKNIKIVVITSPTYEGIVSEVRKIADITHKYNAYLIVDEAHGAHFSLSPYFPESSVSQGADIVIQSLHKTLPSFTQTAVLHIASDRVDQRSVEDMLDVFETSSPSYLLMAGIEQCVRLLEDSGDILFKEYYQRLCSFYQNCKSLRRLKVLTCSDYEKQFYDVDMSKVVISTLDTAIDGKQLYLRLLDNYHLQLEMYSAEYVLAMTSIMDTKEGFERLYQALAEIDEDLCESHCLSSDSKKTNPLDDNFINRAYGPRQKAVEIADLHNMSVEEIEAKHCAGRICAEYIYLYPPGIPMIVPGEVITEDFVQLLEECRNMGLNIQGPRDSEYRKLCVYV